MSVPTASASPAQTKNESPAPAASFGAVLNAGSRSVSTEPRPAAACTSRPSAASVRITFFALAFCRSASTSTTRPESKSLKASRASRSVGLISSMLLKREMSPTCDDDWLSATIGIDRSRHSALIASTSLVGRQP